MKEISKLLLFVKMEGCAKCAEVKGLLNKSEAPLDLFDIDTVDGMVEMRFREIRQVPTLMAIDEDGNEVMRTTDKDEIVAALKKQG